MANFAYEVFATVVAQKTFYQAAATLNVTPSAVSHSVNQLEKDLGFPLFIRNRSGVELTSDGRQVLPYVQEILNTESNLRQVADNIQGLHSGSVRIGGFSSVCINWLPRIIRQFNHEYPDIKISVVQGDFNEITKWAKIGTIDIGFTSMPVSENLLVHSLINDPIYCVTPADFIPENGDYVTTDDVADKNFILQRSDYDRDTKLALDHYHVTNNFLRFSIDDQSIISMVESGLGMGILPQLALRKLTGDVNTFPFAEPYNREIALVANKTQATAPSTAVMIRAIKQFLTAEYPDQMLWQ